MSSSDFRQITNKGEGRRAERLFRATVSAFCCLTRPARRDVAQLEDLTLPLFDLVSTDSLRYVAAALSECETQPPALVRRLCDQPVDVCAPLLLRSPVLADIDLIALIARHGLRHAQVIGRRPGLNPAIAQLISALEKRAPLTVPVKPALPAASEQEETSPSPASALEAARTQLRAMMADAGQSPRPLPAGPLYARLRDAVLGGEPGRLQAELTQALGIEDRADCPMVGTAGESWLLAALRALNLDEAEAFLITAASAPGRFAGLEAIRLFVMRYRMLHPDVALDRIRRRAAGQATPEQADLRAAAG